MITLIVAMDKDGTIGRNGNLPWHIPADLRWFKKVTKNNIVIMGRHTWESLKIQPLPSRINIVVSKKYGVSRHTLNRDGAYWVYSILDAIELAEKLDDGETFIIGGAQLYEGTLELNIVDRMLITVIKHGVQNKQPSDIFFPEYDKKLWSSKIIKDTGEFTVIESHRVYSSMVEREDFNPPVVGSSPTKPSPT